MIRSSHLQALVTEGLYIYVVYTVVYLYEIQLYNFENGVGSFGSLEDNHVPGGMND